MNKFYNFEDEVPKGTKVSTPLDCLECCEECYEQYCLIEEPSLKEAEVQLEKRKQAHEVLKSNHQLLKDTIKANRK